MTGRRSNLVDADDCHNERLISKTASAKSAQVLCCLVQLRLRRACTCRAASLRPWASLRLSTPSAAEGPADRLRDGWLSTRVFQVFGEHSTLSVSFVAQKNHRALSVPFHLSSLRTNSHNWQPGHCTSIPLQQFTCGFRGQVQIKTLASKFW